MDWIEQNKGKAVQAQNAARASGLEGLAPGNIGMVSSLKGDSYAISSDASGAETRRTLHCGDNITAQDRLQTGKDAALRITLKDQSTISLGANTAMDMKAIPAADNGRDPAGSAGIISGRPATAAGEGPRYAPPVVLGVRG